MDWRSDLTNNDRLRYVGVLVQALKELTLLSNQNAATFDINKLKRSAEEFEKYCYQSANNRVSYVQLFKQKILSIKNSIQQQRLQQQQQTLNGSLSLQQGQNQPNPNLQNPAQILQQAQQQQNLQQNNTQDQELWNNGANTSSQAFLAQQAQARQQTAQQLRQQNQNQNQNPAQSQSQPNAQNFNLNTNNKVPNNLNNQTRIQQPVNSAQQLSINIKTLPIPPALLQRIPNLPPNVNTWQQIFELVQSRQIDSQYLAIIRQIYTIHTQLVQKQQQKTNPQATVQNQVLNQQQKSFQQQQQLSDNARIAPQQQQKAINRPQSTSQVQPQQNQTQNQPQQQQAQSVQADQQGLNQAQAQLPPLTPQLLQRLTENALQLLNKLQQEKQIPDSLNNEQRSMFVKRYIARQQQVRLESFRNSQNNQNVGNAQNLQRNVPQNVSNQQFPQNQQQNWGNNVNPAVNPINMSNDSSLIGNPLNNRRQQQQNYIPNQQQQQSQTAMQSQQTQQRANSQTTSTALNNSNVRPNLGNTGAGPNPKGNMLIPSEQDRVELRSILNEVSKVPIKLSNLTNSLTAEQKQIVSSKVHSLLLPLFSLIEQLVPTFYTLTKNVDGTKKLLHMRFMVKEVLDGLRRQEYYASPELLEKVKTQSQKYVAFVKDQISRKNNPTQAGNDFSNNSIQTGNNFNSNNAATHNDINPQQILQQKNIAQQITPQQLLQQQQPQQSNSYQSNLQTSQFLNNNLNNGANDFTLDLGSMNPNIDLINARTTTPDLGSFTVNGRNESSPFIANASFITTPNFINSPQLTNPQFSQQPPPTGNFNNQAQNPALRQHIPPQQQMGVQQSLPQQANVQPAPVKKAPAKRRNTKTNVNTKKTPGSSTPTSATGSTRIPIPNAAESNATATNVAPAAATPTAAAVSQQPVNPAQAQLLKKEQELIVKEEQERRTFVEKRQKRLDLFRIKPFDFFAASLANLLELTDEENKILNESKVNYNDIQKSPVQKGLTPSAILQTPLTFSNSAKTPNSSSKNVLSSSSAVYLSPKQSPGSKVSGSAGSAARWGTKVSREAIISTFLEIDEIKKLLFIDESEKSKEPNAIIPTPPPESSKKTTLSSIQEDGELETFKKIKIDQWNNFYNENGIKLNSDYMWNWDYVSQNLSG